MQPDFNSGEEKSGARIRNGDSEISR